MKKKSVIDLQSERESASQAPRFGTKADVARMTQLCSRSIDNLLRAGLPHLKIGTRRTRFDLDEVRLWLREKYGTRRHGSNGIMRSPGTAQ